MPKYKVKWRPAKCISPRLSNGEYEQYFDSDNEAFEFFNEELKYTQYTELSKLPFRPTITDYDNHCSNLVISFVDSDNDVEEVSPDYWVE